MGVDFGEITSTDIENDRVTRYQGMSITRQHAFLAFTYLPLRRQNMIGRAFQSTTCFSLRPFTRLTTMTRGTRSRRAARGPVWNMSRDLES